MVQMFLFGIRLSLETQLGESGTLIMVNSDNVCIFPFGKLIC